ncbi:MAG: T9SS type A sorting domain-containing protein [Chitinophagales bacterium]|nr:T9SS type A sorting domain-containing protein [Chitinophagales bacterium]
MKSLRTLLLVLAIAVSLNVSAQLPNTSFENWTTDTAVWGLLTYVPEDTFQFEQPTTWTSSNTITGNANIGGKFFVEKSNDSYAGSFAVQLTTDTLYVPSQNLQLTIPGFLANGNFTIDLLNIVLNGGGQISPLALPGAGSPLNVRKKSIGAWVKYSPVANDSLLIWAVLKKNGQLVGEALLSSSDTLNNYTYIETEFVYTNCETPDSIVVLIGSSTPDFAALIGGGNGGLQPGSVLLVDSIVLNDFGVGEGTDVIANNDQTFTTANIAKNVAVLANDTSCGTTISALTIIEDALHGTTLVTDSNTVLYTPDTGFIGIDSFTYRITDGTVADTAVVRMSVFTTTGINELDTYQVTLFPNPVAADLTVQLNKQMHFVATLVNLLGETVNQSALVSDQAKIDTRGIANGIYIIRITDEAGNQLANQRVMIQH